MNYELKSISVGYGKTIIASNINAALRGGELACLLGPNGAGKSTLLRTLSCFQSALRGELLLNGKNVAQMEAHELSRMIGVVLTDRVSVQGLSVRNLVAMGRAPYTNYWGTLTKEDERIIDKAIEQCGIQELTERDSTTLSDGERQKVMIAKALAQQTPIILLDEPTAFLDFPSKVDTMLLLKRLAHESGKAVLISTHDLDLALQTADNLWLMRKHNDIIVGTPQNLANDGSLAKCFSNANITFSPELLRFNIHK